MMYGKSKQIVSYQFSPKTAPEHQIIQPIFQAIAQAFGAVEAYCAFSGVVDVKIIFCVGFWFMVIPFIN